MAATEKKSAVQFKKARPEREFIRGHRDGPSRTNDTYTVCRLRVPEDRLNKEMALGIHSHFVRADGCWSCPAYDLVKAEKKWLKHKEKRTGKKLQEYPAPSAVDYERWLARHQDSNAVEPLEIVQRDPDTSETEPTFTLCRIGVPRLKMVREVEANLHPGYHVRTGSRGRFVQGNPTRPFDNVNFPEDGKAGLGPRDVCPFRLLRAGAKL